MELQRAIEQISEIHAHVLRAEVFRGYRAVTMAITSALAIATASLVASVIRPTGIAEALTPWIGYAALSGLVCGADLATNCILRGRRFWRQAVLVVSQFVPALISGILATAILMPLEGASPTLLPGIWTLLFGLGIFSSLPYLPRALGWVAAGYIAAGAMMLWAATQTPLPSPWAMGLTFGVGQAAAANVLHRQLEEERRGH